MAEQSPEGEERAFQPSVPRLEPDLDTVGVSSEAEHLKERSDEIEGNIKPYEELSAKLLALDEAREAARSLLQNDQFNLFAEDRVKLEEVLENLEGLKGHEGISPWVNTGYDLRSSDELTEQRDGVMWRAQNHLRANEEAYKNQAVNDYRHAQAADPGRYPEPLNYPGYTDQAPPTPEAPDGGDSKSESTSPYDYPERIDDWRPSSE